MKTRRLISVVTAFMMALTLLPVQSFSVEKGPQRASKDRYAIHNEAVFSAEGTTSYTQGTVIASGISEENLNWELCDDGTLIISGNGPMKDYSPAGGGYTSWIDANLGYSVEGGYNDDVKKIVISSGITKIGNAAFHFCRNLVGVEIADTVISIGDYAFHCCFNLESVSISDSVTTIGDIAFSECDNLTSITIPPNVVSIGFLAFSGCGALHSIRFSGNAPIFGDEYMDVFEGVNATAYYPQGNSTWTSDVMQDYGGNITWEPYDSQAGVRIASGICGESMAWALYSNGLLEVSGIGEMSLIQELAWFQYQDQIRQVIIEDGVTSIDDNAFTDCKNLTSVLIPDSVTKIGSLAFYGCENLTDINLPSGLKNISAFMLADCYSLTNVTIPDCVTDIGVCAFQACKNLTSITIPDGVTRIHYCAFIFCENLRNISIPDSVTEIEERAFRCCYSLTSMSIPGSVKTIGYNVFSECYSLKSVAFFGDAPTFGENVFNEVTANVYYPGNNATWTADKMQNYGGNIAWFPSNWDITMGSPCSLAELTTLDYLAFSQIAYEDFIVGETVYWCLLRQNGNEWDDVWGENGITYAELCNHIAQWKVCYVSENTSNGFYAVAFQNDQDEIVIAYRGSIALAFENIGSDLWNDWIENDLPMIIFNEISDKNQIGDAFWMYADVLDEFAPKEIVVTGHSLGGGLGNLVSARFGCRAETVNAISVLDVMYYHGPDIFGENFGGVDLWNMLDHANHLDFAAGVFEELSTTIKPYVAYESLLHATDLFGHHGLSSYVEKRADGKVDLTKKLYDFIPTSPISKILHSKYPWGIAAIDLGTSKNDVFSLGLAQDVSRTSYGGEGNDYILTSSWADSLIGGNGADTLDGAWGNDKYIYYRGDGLDTIYDIAGNDTLYLYGFSDSDKIEVFAGGSESSFIEVLCNGESIVRISKNNRSYSLFTLDKFIIRKDLGNYIYDEYDITSMFKKKNYAQHLLIACPVSIEIMDTDGNAVYTLEDGVPGSHYTDYGNFYIFEEENGGYGKVLDLVAGYTARIVGEDAGTMDITYQDVADGALTEAKIVTDIPISESATATIQQNEDGKLVLAVDVDSDGMIDEETMFVCAENHNYENGFCTECGKAAPTAKFTTISTSLGGNIAMNFYMELSEDLVSDPNAYIQFTFAGRTVNVPLSQGVVSGNTYRFSCPITSKNMTDEITAQVYNENGPVGNSKTMDVATYCNWVIDNYTDAKTVNLMKAMLNYGASAQMLFNYRTDDLANAALSDADKVLGKVDASAYVHSRTGEEEGIKPDNYTLLLDSETTVRVYFKLTGDKTIDEYTFTVDGVEVTPVYKNGLYYIQKTDIGAHRLDELHVFTCGDITITYGGLSYVNQVMTYYESGTTFDMASALFAYSKAAEDYIG